MGPTQSWFCAWVVGGSISPTSFHPPHQQGGLPSTAPLHDAASTKERSWFSCPPAFRAESIHTSTTRASSAVLLRLGAGVILLSATAGERQGQGSYLPVGGREEPSLPLPHHLMADEPQVESLTFTFLGQLTSDPPKPHSPSPHPSSAGSPKPCCPGEVQGRLPRVLQLVEAGRDLLSCLLQMVRSEVGRTSFPCPCHRMVDRGAGSALPLSLPSG